MTGASVSGAVPQTLGARRARRLLVALGIALLALGALGLRTEDLSATTSPWAFDFNVNWVAAERLVEREPLYDQAASRADAVREIGRRMRSYYTVPFDGYIGAPVVALLSVPLLPFGHDTGLAIARVLTLVGIVAALALTAASLERRARLPALLVGLGGLVLFVPTVRTLEYAQAHGVVMLGLALGIWGTARRRWSVAGIGLGVATALKVSPVLLVLYLALRRQWRAVGWAAGTAAALSAVAAAVGRPGDLLVWIRHVAPSVAQGTRHVYDQALPAWLARMTSRFPSIVTHGSIGGWRFLGVALGLAVTFGLWRARRAREIDPLDLGVLVLAGLLAGPLTWDHYCVWALIPLALMADPARWAGRSVGEAAALVAALGGGALLMHVFLNSTWALTLGSDPLSQLRSGPYTLALLVDLGVALRLLAPPPHDATGGVPERAVPLLATR